jgi:FlaA1/EpsC-like NDP-sugar epimerase
VNEQTSPPLVGGSPAARAAVLFAFHAIVLTGCAVLAWMLRFDFEIPKSYKEIFLSSLPIIVGVQLFVGFFFGFYRGWWRYVGLADVMRLMLGISVAFALLTAGWYVGTMYGIPERLVKAPRGVLLINWAFALLALFGARVLIRLGRDRFRPAEGRESVKRVVIIGAGDAGETLAREIEHRPQLGMKVVAFVDDHRAKWNAQIRGITVSGPIANLPAIAESLSIDEALIAIPSASGKRMREIIGHLSEAGLPFKTIPGIDQLVSGQVDVSQLRPVNVDDLLRREPITLEGDPVRALFQGKRVMVTGAGGTIGSELASQVLQFRPESLTLVERSEYLLYEVHKRLTREAGWSMNDVHCKLADVQDDSIMRGIIDSTSPDIVLHAAAHKHVPLGEQNPAEYVRNNALATRRLAEICEAAGVDRFVLISTDKAINPTSVMGASKRAAEILLLDLARTTRMTMTIVRFGNVIGSSGSVIPLFMEQLAAGGPLTVTHPDVTRYFIRTSEAISLVLQAATLGNDGHVFMLDMGEPVKIADLAQDLIQLSNKTGAVDVVYTGLRTGEKLFEEISLEGESVHPTIHPQIVVTEAPQPSSELIARWMSRAQLVCKADGAVVPLLQELIPEYSAAAVHGPARPAPTYQDPMIPVLKETRIASTH